MSDSALPLRPVFDYSPSSMVILIVGDQQEQLLAHASYLTNRSDFFKAALSNNWKEGQSRVVKLPEDDPTTVAQYLDFVYKNMLPTQQKWFPNQVKSMYLSLARLYVYGERVLDVVIRNVIVDHIIAFSSIANHELATHPHYPGPAVIETVYEGTTAESPMRRLLVDMYVKHGERKWLEPELHPAFVQDVARKLMVGRIVLGDLTMRKGDYYLQ